MSGNTFKGIHKVKTKSKNGVTREYHRLGRGKNSTTFWKSSDGTEEGSEEYFSAFYRALDSMSYSKGKFREVIIAYLESPRFNNLAERTRKGIKRTIFLPNGIDTEFGELKTEAFEHHSIRARATIWRDQGWGASRQADLSMSHLKALITWAVRNGYLRTNQLEPIGKVYSNDRSGIYWTDEEIDLFCSDPVPKHIQNILILISYTGLAPSDAARLTRRNIEATRSGYRISLRRSKTGVLACPPVVPQVEQLLDELPLEQDYVLTNSNGKPWANPNNLGRAVAKWRDHVGIRKELHLYDARGTAAKRFLNASFNLQEIALVMGWRIQTAARNIDAYARPDVRKTDYMLKRYLEFRGR